MIRLLRIAALLITLFAFNQAYAEKSQWHKLSNDDYIAQRVICQQEIEAFYQELRIQNLTKNTTKTSSNVNLKIQKLTDKVLKSVKMEQALIELYQVEITLDSLQEDLDRMIRRSQDTEHLKALFQLLNNDPNTIAECISRPYLVERNIRKYYQSHNQENTSLKQTINQVRSSSKSSLNSDSPESVIYQFKYHLENSQTQSLEALFDVKELPEEDFHKKLTVLNAQLNDDMLPLQETTDFFFTEKLIKSTNEWIVVEIESWGKKLFDQWWLSTEKAVNTIRIKGLAHKLRLNDFPLKKKSKLNDLNNELGEWQTFIPEPRYGHTAIWTGSEMIIWGGVSSGSDLIFHQDGFKYNPITDSWVPISLENAPQGRVYHSAIWTGSQMVVWGGNNYDGYFQDGKLYNPNDDSWSDLNLENAPSPRSYHQAFAAGRYMIIWDGFAFNYEPDHGHIYDFVTNSWRAISHENAPSLRDFSAAVWTGTELIIWGGRDRSGESNGYLESGAKYNLTQDRWESISKANAPAARYRHHAVWTGDKMLIWGSSSSASSHRFGGVYNPITDTWTQMSIENQPPTSSYNTLIWTGDEMITWGGHNGSSNEISGGVYSPEMNQWRSVTAAGAPIRKSDHSAVWTGTEMIVWGGSNSNTGGRYNPTNNSWILTNETPGSPAHRGYNSTIWTGAEMIVWGGQIDYNIGADTGGLYDPITDRWLAINTINAPAPRYLHTAVWTGSEMIIWGGGTWENGLNTGGIYNPVSNNWTEVTLEGAPEARINHTSVWTGEEMIVWGGRSEGINTNTGGRFNPFSNTWTPTSVLDAPQGRRFHTATWTNNEMIIWGGEYRDNRALNQNFIYYPESDSWQQIEYQGDFPYHTAKHTAVWADDSLITWGGTTRQGAVTGYKFNPSNYMTEEILAPDFLGPKESHTAVWTGNEMIVWGGDGENVPGRFSLTRNGGKYNPANNSWVETDLVGAPAITANHKAVWTGKNMLVWSGGTLRTYYPNGKSEYMIDEQISGNWYNPEQSGHGLQLEIIEQNNAPAILAAWYTYLDGKPVWLIGVGEVENNHVEIDMNITTGTGFPVEGFNSEDVVIHSWGTIKLYFDSAATGRLTWSSDYFENASGGFNIERITQIFPDHSDASGIRSCHSGSWYDQNQSGHGLMVNVIDDGSNQNILLAWYTYLNGEQYWLLGTGPITGNSAQITAISGAGADFPPNFNAEDLSLSNWGDLSFTLVDDTQATFQWESNISNFPSGSIDVTRLTQLMGHPCD